LNQNLKIILLATIISCVLPHRTTAQLFPEPEGTTLPAYAKVRLPTDDCQSIEQAIGTTNGLPNIMLTGYWPPTNEMLRQFSKNAVQNPSGWVGQDWEGRGYNIYAFFSEFPSGIGKGDGDFEVDYQDTSADFWRITGEVKPVALITFGVGEDNTHDWEVESRHQNRSSWWFDYQFPFFPSPSPPDDSVAANYTRYSTLPMQEIVDAVDAAGLGVTAFVSDNYGGTFLCEYIGYHATWYHDLHANPDDPEWNIAAGHIHIGGITDLADAIQATKITLRTLIFYLDTQLPIPADFDGDRDVDQADFDIFQACSTGPVIAYNPQNLPAGCTMTADNQGIIAADFDIDLDVDQSDFGIFQRCISGDNNPGNPHCAQ